MMFGSRPFPRSKPNYVFSNLQSVHNLNFTLNFQEVRTYFDSPKTHFRSSSVVFIENEGENKTATNKFQPTQHTHSSPNNNVDNKNNYVNRYSNNKYNNKNNKNNNSSNSSNSNNSSNRKTINSDNEKKTVNKYNQNRYNDNKQTNKNSTFVATKNEFLVNQNMYELLENLM